MQFMALTNIIQSNIKFPQSLGWSKENEIFCLAWRDINPNPAINPHLPVLNYIVNLPSRIFGLI